LLLAIINAFHRLNSLFEGQLSAAALQEIPARPHPCRAICIKIKNLMQSLLRSMMPFIEVWLRFNARLRPETRR